MGSSHTHVLKYNGGEFTREMGSGKTVDTFARALRLFNGEKPWALGLVRLPDGMDYGEMLKAGIEVHEFLQAGGSAACMTVEIRKPGGRRWGVESVWSVVGHRADGDQELDVPVRLPRSTQMISKAEVFEAEEAAELFMSYYTTGDIPAGYILRPIEGWTAEGDRVDLSSTVA